MASPSVSLTVSPPPPPPAQCTGWSEDVWINKPLREAGVDI